MTSVPPSPAPAAAPVPPTPAAKPVRPTRPWRVPSGKPGTENTPSCNPNYRPPTPK